MLSRPATGITWSSVIAGALDVLIVFLLSRARLLCVRRVTATIVGHDRFMIKSFTDMIDTGIKS